MRVEVPTPATWRLSDPGGRHFFLRGARLGGRMVPTLGGAMLIANTMWRAPFRAAARAHLRPAYADALSLCFDSRR